MEPLVVGGLRSPLDLEGRHDILWVHLKPSKQDSFDVIRWPRDPATEFSG